MNGVGAEHLIRKAFSRWWKSDPMNMGASLAYYTLFSLAPMFFLIIIIAGVFLSPQIVEGKLISELGGVVGPRVAELIQDVVLSLGRTRSNLLVSIIGVLLIVVGSSSMFTQLRRSMNRIWESQEPANTSIESFFERLVAAIGMIIVLSIVFIVSFMISALSSTFLSFIKAGPMTENLVSFVNYTGSFAIICILFALLYKYLPSAKVNWSSALVGSVYTGILFIIGRFIISLYLQLSGTVTSYGAAGAVIILLIWVYYTAQIFFLGAAFAYVLDERSKRHIHDASIRQN